jgi:hypothetical protein
MPNWCENNLSISGPTSKIEDKFRGLIGNGEGLLNTVRPQPENLFQDDLSAQDKEDCKKKGIPNWYDWNIANWGTKWEASDCDLDIQDNGDGTSTLYAFFLTAWCPPVEAFTELDEDLIVSLEFHEGGMAFVGQYTSEGGYEEYDYSDENLTPLNVKDFIPENLVEDWCIREYLEEDE